MLGAAAVVGIGKKREIMTNLPRCTMTTSSSQNNFCDGVAGDDCRVSVARTAWVVAGRGNVSGGGVRQENRVSIVSGHNRHPIFLTDEGGGTIRTCQLAAL